uniref:Uncharacterized protein n=1 Tax=Romanomermis culicivorax TaxID=13658 RepID=A0A915JMJ3_ROMCU
MDQPSEIVVNVDNDIISAKAKTSTPRKRKEVPRKAANFLDATLSMSGINPSFDNDKLFFLGNHAIEIDSLMEPPLEWIDREINQHHVDFLFNFFCEKPSSIFSMSPWLVIIKATRGQFDPNKVHLFEKVLIGGRHRKLALQKLKVERPEIFTSMWRNNIIHATCYSSEMPSELIALKAMENNIDNRQGLKSDWFDR